MDDPAAVVVNGRWPALSKLVWRKDFGGRSREPDSPGAAGAITLDHPVGPYRHTDPRDAWRRIRAAGSPAGIWRRPSASDRLLRRRGSAWGRTTPGRHGMTYEVGGGGDRVQDIVEQPRVASEV